MKNTLDYYTKATQSVFIVAGILMLVTFPYFFTKFEPAVLSVLALIVLLAIAAGLSSTGSFITKKLNVLISIAACGISSYRAVKIFFTNPEEPVIIFSFWILQILSLLFFFAIYFSIRAVKNR